MSSGPYKTIVADPAWAERGGGRRGAQNHYPVMSEAQILRTMRGADAFHPAPDCHMYMWVTNNHLVSGIRILGSLGFRYVTNMCWYKTGSFGILGRKGSSQRKARLFL
jgi:N6-adenosine-specific RNA methylase IME4